MKKQKGFIIPIVIILVLIVLSVIVYFFSPKSINIKIPTASPSASADPTANWKTYTNETYGFTLEYPQGLVVTDEEDGGRFNFSMRQQNDVPILNLNIYTQGQEPMLSQERYKNRLQIGGIDWEEYYYPAGNIEFGGSDSSKNAEMTLFNLKKVNISYELVFYGQSILSPLQSEILSTFKFIDDNELSCNVNSDCEVESCGCTPKNKNYIDQKRNICTVICNKPSCVDNICVISK